MKFIVNGRKRHYPEELWENLIGEKPPPGFTCNGCTNSPDYFRRFFIWPACIVHDFHYSGVLGGSWASRREADRIFYKNLKIELIDQEAPWALSATLPWIYWGRVRLHGAGHYPFSEGESPQSWWQRFREVYGIFFDQQK